MVAVTYNMKENRARAYDDKMSDAEVSLLDQMITSMAGVLGDLYREILYLGGGK